MNKKINSVRNLANLYTVVIGVALSSGVVSLIDPSVGLESINVVNGFLFLAFLFTIVPFYHGALRHLDDAYIENKTDIRNGALLIDFLLLFFHGVAFVILSLLYENPSHFAWVITIVLVIDVVWAIFVHFGSSSNTSDEWKWLLINLITVCIAVVFLISFDVYFQTLIAPEKLSIFIFIASMLRTLADYCFCWGFYFPSDP